MKIACWSGPRNISTALMRSWSSRNDTFVSDEPFYAHYLKETGLNHPMKEKIINNYCTNSNKIIKNLTSKVPNNNKIWYQKHMAHHILNTNDLSWIKNFENCILIRHPKFVINSYIKKNELNSITDLGYPQQLSIIEFLQKENIKFYIIESDIFLNNPKKALSDWCNFLRIDFDQKMLSWPKGPHINDGIWGMHWYENINNSQKFSKKIGDSSNKFEDFKFIYDDAVHLYKKIYNMQY
tara:strand:- start:1016 stop:1729 length:714 start_codon:yes stop_codon:yes gene_type:complete